VPAEEGERTVLRPARESDVEVIREWRNQQANREVSNNQHVISPDEHQAWWERTSHDPTRRVLVLEIGDRACGVVNFFDLAPEDEKRTGSWGFFLDHEGLSADDATFVAWNTAMKEAIEYAFDELGLDVLEAEVLEENEAVRATNRRFRFTEGTPQTREADGRTTTVIPISLRREDRRRARRSS
jgi:RimJ/RimL family protein N-acetyltransferase